MPIPATNQPMSMAPGPATEEIFWGSENMPAPTVDPIISATSVHNDTEWDLFWLEVIGLKYRARPAKGNLRIYTG